MTMKVIKRSSLLLLSGIFLMTNASLINVQASQDHDHAHHEEAQGMQLNHGQKWEIDKPLALGMQNISEVIHASLDAYHHETFSKEAAQKVSKQINEQVSYLITNCDLAPEADATLHVLIAQLVSAAQNIKAEPLSKDGIPKAVKALNSYPDYFAHEGWVKITH